MNDSSRADDFGSDTSASTPDTAADLVTAPPSAVTDEVRDELPEDLVAHGYVGPYQFPDNSRRRIPGVMYLVLAAICVGIWLIWSDTTTAVNGGFLGAGVLLAAAAAMHLGSGWRMRVDESQALAAAAGSVGFAVGHASAQQVWRGLRSRPTWRVLCYSADDPPTRRALVLVDAVDATVIECLAEDNPELDVLEMPATSSDPVPDGRGSVG